MAKLSARITSYNVCYTKLLRKKDESLTEEELKAFCKEKLAAYKVPTHYEFRSELPPRHSTTNIETFERDTEGMPTLLDFELDFLA